MSVPIVLPGITAVLTTITVMNIQNKRMPKVSYFKLADWYLIVCFVFVFGTLIEYTVVLMLHQQRQQEEQQQQQQQQQEEEEEEQQQTDQHMLNGSCGEYNGLEEEVETDFKDGKNSGNTELLLNHNDNKDHERNGGRWYQGREVQPSPQRLLIAESCEKRFDLDEIDEFSRILFPCVFLVFNVVYWFYFMEKKDALHTWESYYSSAGILHMH